MKKDALETLGHLITPDEVRDAVHIACLPAICSPISLSVGVNVCYVDGKGFAPQPNGPKPIGIVDPFLTKQVHPGERFWIMLYPRTITGLRHIWTHPDLPDLEEGQALTDSSTEVAFSLLEEKVAKEKDEARRYLQEEATFCGMDFDTLMNAAERFRETGETHYTYNDDIWLRNEKNFWRCYEIYTGKEVSPDRIESFFRCAC